MDRFLIRKRPREEDSGTDGASAAAAGTRPPACVISWNANSIKLRAERKELGAARVARKELAAWGLCRL